MFLTSPPDLEIVTVKLGVDRNLILCTIYVPPSACESYVCSLTEYLAVLQSSYDHCISQTLIGYHLMAHLFYLIAFVILYLIVTLPNM